MKSLRHFTILAALLFTPMSAFADPAQNGPWLHATSLTGEPKYPAGFPHFDYVNLDAPKGGLFSQIGPSRQYNQNFLTFNSLNTYILRGDGAQGMQLTFAALMQGAGDEPEASRAEHAGASRQDRKDGPAVVARCGGEVWTECFSDRHSAARAFFF